MTSSISLNSQEINDMLAHGKETDPKGGKNIEK